MPFLASLASSSPGSYNGLGVNCLLKDRGSSAPADCRLPWECSCLFVIVALIQHHWKVHHTYTDTQQKETVWEIHFLTYWLLAVLTYSSMGYWKDLLWYFNMFLSRTQCFIRGNFFQWLFLGVINTDVRLTPSDKEMHWSKSWGQFPTSSSKASTCQYQFGLILISPLELQHR